jgi:PAS domain S-box-containing protein
MVSLEPEDGLEDRRRKGLTRRMKKEEHQRRIAQIIFESISDGVFTTDRECRITSFNVAAERISGFSREEAIGRYCFDIFRTELCHERCALRCTLQNGESVSSVRVTIITRDGRKVPISVSTNLLRDEEGQTVGAVEFFRDLSEVENLERRIQKITGIGNLVSANEEMQQVFSLLPEVAESECSVLIQGRAERARSSWPRPSTTSARGERAPSSRSTAAPCRRTCSSPSSSATSAEPSRTPGAASPASSRSPTAARSCSTRSERCRRRCR